MITTTDNYAEGMRITYVLLSTQIGGAERQALLMARQFLARGAHPVISAPGNEGPLVDRCNEYGLTFAPMPEIQLKRAQLPQSLLRWRQALAKTRPDLIISTTGLPNILVALIWRFTGARGGIWSQVDEGLMMPERRLTRWATQLPATFTSISPACTNYLTANFGIDPDRVVLIPMTVEMPDAKSSPSEWRQKLEVAPDAFLALMIGNISKFKDHLTLVDAWAQFVHRMPADAPQPRLVLAGRKDNMYEPVQQRIASHGIEDSILMLDFVDDVSGLLHTCDVNVLSSPSEGAGLSVLEAMCCARAVIGSDVPGIRWTLDTLASDETLFPVRDSAALCECLWQLYQNPDRRDALARQGYELSQSYTLEAIGQQWEQRILRHYHPQHAASL